jgi:lipopolysaccharide export system permease protein
VIINRYIASQIIKGAALVLFILVSLSMFFSLIRELDDLGRGQYGVWELIQYLLLQVPSFVVDYMPLAALVGCMLSLGSLAGNSELIAMQSSGLSINKLIMAVAQSVFILALGSLLMADFVVPHTQTQAKQLRASSLSSNVSLNSRKGVWVKDEHNIIFIEQLYPDGNAQNIEIHYLHDNGELRQTQRARQAIVSASGWTLFDVKTTTLSDQRTSVLTQDEIRYQGQVSQRLLETISVEPQQMSIGKLFSYTSFLRLNNLNNQAEALFLWRKIYAPLSVIVMGILAIPFVLGSQRQKNTGQRLMLGILLGLLYVVLNRLLIQLGEQLQLVAYINALIPTLFFSLLTVWLIKRKIAPQ